MKKVMVFGTFDIIHPGHIHMLKEAKSYGDYLTAIISRDITVNQIKSRPARNNELVRLQNLVNLKIVDKVRLGNLADKHQVIFEEEPDVIALGYDQKFFIDDLKKVVSDKVEIIRLSPYHPEIYKSSKLDSRTNNYAG